MLYLAKISSFFNNVKSFWLVHIMKCLLIQPIMVSLWKCCTTNLYMRLFFLTPSLIGSINARIFILTNWQVVHIGLKCHSVTQASSFFAISKLPYTLFEPNCEVHVQLWISDTRDQRLKIPLKDGILYGSFTQH